MKTTYSIFGEDSTGLHWLANLETFEQAQSLLDSGDFNHYDFVMIMPVVCFRNVDGDRVK